MSWPKKTRTDSLDKAPDTPSPNPGTKPILGSWGEGGFAFASPEAQEVWHRSAYAQAVDPEAWHLGRKVDEKTRAVMEAGLAGAQPPYFYGPDQQARMGNAGTLERDSLREIRARHFRGKSSLDIERAYAGGSLPGEDEAVAHLLGARNAPVQPNAPVQSNASLSVAANNNEPLLSDRKDVGAYLKQLSDPGIGSMAAAPGDLLVAQADTGVASDATAVDDPALAFPSGSATPAYPGEEKTHGKRSQEAEAFIPKIQRTGLWPVAGDHRLNERKEGGQGSGYYGTTRNGGKKVHNGFDISADVDAPVVAAKDGVIVRVINKIGQGAKDDNVGFGNEVIIDHGDGTWTQYAHLGPAFDAAGRPLMDKDGKARVVLKEGTKVKTGQVIGSVGRTGNVGKGSDPHLHFEVRIFNNGLSAAKRQTVHPGYFLVAP